ncbi:MAG: TylF/MycF/NovP-related O-methyltransferase [Trichlorobacter sp.]|nr:TylF/MycF/NovP-related O-methyltransferase [Trichlorobacter sp.]
MHNTITLENLVQPFIVNSHSDFVTIYEEGLRLTEMQDNSWRRPRFFHMVQMLRLTRGLAGMTAEAGVYRGLASYLICRTRQQEAGGGFNGTGHFALDSFAGLPEPTRKDGYLRCAGRFSDTSEEIARRTLEHFPGVEILKGWIPEVLSELPDQTYRFVHVDVDLYDPTIACLEYFFSRLLPGGIIIVDDYGPWPTGEWPGCRAAVHEFSYRHSMPFATLDTGNVVIVKR